MMAAEVGRGGSASLCGIDCLAEDAVPQGLVQSFRGDEIDGPAQKLGKPALKPGEPEETDACPWLELDEDVNVAVWAEFATDDRTEEAERVHFVLSHQNGVGTQ